MEEVNDEWIAGLISYFALQDFLEAITEVIFEEVINDGTM